MSIYAKGKVAGVEVVWNNFTSKEVLEAFGELFGAHEGPTLASADVKLILENLPTPVANALRRELCDEMIGYHLDFQKFSLETTEVYMLPQFVRTKINTIPLNSSIQDWSQYQFSLDITNTTTSTIYVYSGDLAIEESPGDNMIPFEPFSMICSLEAGKRLKIDSIYVDQGRGIEHGSFSNMSAVTSTPLDLERRPVAETHDRGGASVDKSEYVESCLVANPQKHLITGTIPACGKNARSVAQIILSNACNEIVDRLQVAAAAMEKNHQGPASFTLRPPEYGTGLEEGKLMIPNETHTIGNLLNRAIYDTKPDIANVNYTVGRSHMTLTVQNDSGTVLKLVLDAINDCIKLFNRLSKEMLN